MGKHTEMNKQWNGSDALDFVSAVIFLGCKNINNSKQQKTSNKNETKQNKN